MEPIVEEFLHHIHPALRPATRYVKRRRMERFGTFIAGTGKNLSQVRKADIDGYLATLRHYAPATRRDMVMTVRDFYAFAAARCPNEYHFENPVKDVRFYRYKRRVLTLPPGEEQLKTVLQGLRRGEGERRVRNLAMAELAYGSGLRLGEIMALDIEDVDFENVQAYVCGKGGATRLVPLSSAAVQVLRRYIHMRGAVRGPLFVTTKGRRLTRVSISWIFRKKIGIRTHLFRHACATHMLAHGCDVRLIQQLLGHKYLTTTQIYTHIISTDLDTAVRRYHPRSPPRER